MPVPAARGGPGFVVLLAVALGAAPAPGRADPSRVTWGERIAVASGGGHRGPWRMNESEYDYVDDPTVAVTERGVLGIGWADQSRHDIFLRIYEPDGGGRFAEPVNVSGSPRTFSWLPRMLLAPGDASQVCLLWQEIVFSGGSHGGEILFARSTDGGRTFGEPLNLSNSSAGDGKGRLTRRHWHNGSLDLAEGPEGHLYAAWTEYEGSLWFSRSADRGGSFSAPLRIAGDDASPARGPSLAVDAEGAVHLAWAVGEDEAADIRVATSVDRGRSFGGPRIVAAGEGHADAPRIAVDGGGTVHLVYAESPFGPFGHHRIRYTRSRDGGLTFEEPREISGPHVERSGGAHYPALGVDGEDDLYVAWELFPRGEDHPRGLGFARSGDGGRTFASPSVVPGSADPALGVNGGQQGLLMSKLAVNGAGTVAVVNSTFARDEASHVWLFRGRAAGR